MPWYLCLLFTAGQAQSSITYHITSRKKRSTECKATSSSTNRRTKLKKAPCTSKTKEGIPVQDFWGRGRRRRGWCGRRRSLSWRGWMGGGRSCPGRYQGRIRWATKGYMAFWDGSSSWTSRRGFWTERRSCSVVGTWRRESGRDAAADCSCTKGGWCFTKHLDCRMSWTIYQRPMLRFMFPEIMWS